MCVKFHVLQFILSEMKIYVQYVYICKVYEKSKTLPVVYIPHILMIPESFIFCSLKN